jgi:transposase InsO family protein
VKTFNEGQFVLTIRDIGTGFCEVKIMKSKAETCGLLIATIERWEKETGDQVKVVRSNNGGEFSSNVLLEYLTKRRIKAERALPYHHYQNGAIERFNRTLSEMGRTILIDSGLDMSFWGFSFLWAGDTLNRIPNKSSGLVTPFEAFHG